MGIREDGSWLYATIAYYCLQACIDRELVRPLASDMNEQLYADVLENFGLSAM